MLRIAYNSVTSPSPQRLFLSLGHWILLFYAICGSLRLVIGVHSIQSGLICSEIGLSGFQQEICKTRPDAIVAIRDGARKGLIECQHQMRHSRWNCSGTVPKTKQSLFGPVLPIATKEAAFAYAINAAGISHQLTRECTLGRLKGCGCDSKKLESDWQTDKSWRWGGCSADIQYGIKMASLFVDARESINHDETRKLMNLHNNRAGGKILKDLSLSKIECKCHGQSGACNLKTCWTTVAPFRNIGNELYKKYRQAKRITPTTLRTPSRGKRGNGNQRIRKRDLVYLTWSSSYCDYNATADSLGTRGRQCNKWSSGQDSCQLMCCGRGYNTYEIDRKWDCNCKFHWCCEIICKTCQERAEIYMCK